MVVQMDYACPECGGCGVFMNETCPMCGGTGTVRLPCGSMPEAPDMDSGMGNHPRLAPEDVDRAIAETGWYDAFLNWYIDTHKHTPQTLDPVVEAYERSFHAGWVAGGGK